MSLDEPPPDQALSREKSLREDLVHDGNRGGACDVARLHRTPEKDGVWKPEFLDALPVPVDGPAGRALMQVPAVVPYAPGKPAWRDLQATAARVRSNPTP